MARKIVDLALEHLMKCCKYQKDYDALKVLRTEILKCVQKQSGEAPSQQPQLKIPSLEQFMEWSVIQGFDSVQATASYYYIARHIKQVR